MEAVIYGPGDSNHKYGWFVEFSRELPLVLDSAYLQCTSCFSGRSSYILELPTGSGWTTFLWLNEFVSLAHLSGGSRMVPTVPWNPPLGWIYY